MASPGPLAGKTVAVTRAREQAAGLSARLIAMAATVFECPLIRVQPMVDLSSLDRALSQLHSYDWVLFTSVNAVEIACARESWRCPPESRPEIAAVGKGTAAALERLGVPVRLLPPEASGEQLAEALIARGVDGRRILFPRAKVAGDELPDRLLRAGALLEIVTVYETLTDPQGAAPLLAALRQGRLDAVTLGSASAAERFHELLAGESPGRCRVVSIGPATTARASALGLTIDRTAEEHTMEGLAEAVMLELGRR